MIQRSRRKAAHGGCIWILAVLLFLAGCGRKEKVDYQILGEEMDNLSAEISGQKSQLMQFQEETWKENWEIEDTDGGVIEVTVEAEILLPEVKTMSVITVTAPKFDAEWKERIAKGIFGEEEIFYNDLEHLPRRELEKRCAEYDSRLESNEEAIREDAKLSVRKLEKLMENASDTYTPVQSYEGDEYLGEIEGISYELNFYEIEDYMGRDADLQWFDFHAADLASLCPKEYKNAYPYYWSHPFMTCEQYDKRATNDCELSEAEARKLAESFLEELGLEYPVFTESRPLLWCDESMDYMNCNNYPANGYAFSYEYGMDELSFPGFEPDSILYENDSYSPDRSGQSKYAQATLYVMDQGVIGAYIENPIETTQVSENVTLLPLSSVKEILKEQIREKYPEFYYESNAKTMEDRRKLLFTHLELIYYRVNDGKSDENYSYIPVWRLGENQVDRSRMEDREYIKNPVLINAIDGSEIDLELKAAGVVIPH